MNSREIVAGNHQISFRLSGCCLNGWSILRLRLKHHTLHTLFLCLTLRVTFWAALCVPGVTRAPPPCARPYVRLAASPLNLSDGSHRGSHSSGPPLIKAGRRIRFLPFFVSFFSFQTQHPGCLWRWHLLTSFWRWFKWGQYHYPAYHLFSPPN